MSTVTSMESAFIGFYITVFILAGMVAYAGTENTLNLFRYIDLTLRYQWVLLKMFFMRRRLERALKRTMKELHNDRKNSIWMPQVRSQVDWWPTLLVNRKGRRSAWSCWVSLQQPWRSDLYQSLQRIRLRWYLGKPAQYNPTLEPRRWSITSLQKTTKS